MCFSFFWQTTCKSFACPIHFCIDHPLVLLRMSKVVDDANMKSDAESDSGSDFEEVEGDIEDMEQLSKLQDALDRDPSLFDAHEQVIKTSPYSA